MSSLRPMLQQLPAVCENQFFCVESKNICCIIYTGNRICHGKLSNKNCSCKRDFSARVRIFKVVVWLAYSVILKFVKTEWILNRLCKIFLGLRQRILQHLRWKTAGKRYCIYRETSFPLWANALMLFQKYHIHQISVSTAFTPQPSVWVIEASNNEGKEYDALVYLVSYSQQCSNVLGLNNTDISNELCIVQQAVKNGSSEKVRCMNDP